MADPVLILAAPNIALFFSYDCPNPDPTFKKGAPVF